MGSTQKIDIELLRSMPLPNWDDETSKSERGKLLVIAGSRRFPGAAILAARAALRSGCGTVRVAAPESVAVQIGVAVPELMILPLPQTSEGTLDASAAARLLTDQMKVCTAIVLGPGIDENSETEKAVRDLIAKAQLPMVVDAQALLYYDWKHKPIASRILTPHEDEFKKLTGDEKLDMNAPESTISQFVRQSKAILVLKGRHTFIATPDECIFKNEAGSRVLGTAGSGDTLAGIIGGFLAQGMEPTAAAVWGVYLHAVVGEEVSKEVGEDGSMATDFIDRLPGLQRRLRQATNTTATTSDGADSSRR